MRNLITIPLGLFICFCCLSWTTNHQDTTLNQDEKTIILKKTGNEILNGKKISTIDSSLIFTLIDSITTNNPKEREFYFKVFNKINNQAKGELAVEMDWKIKDFCLKYPEEFFSISDSEIKDYTIRIGELFRTQEEYPVETAEEYVKDIRKKVSNKFYNKVNRFSIELINNVKGK